MNKDDEVSLQFKYPNGTLKNKLNETDPERLKTFEYQLVNKRLVWLLTHNKNIAINSVDDLTKIHRFLFEPIYDWAGQIRNYELAKGGTDFMPSESIPMGIRNINQQLKRINTIKEPSAFDYAKLIDSLNYLHPFREGNGRSTRVFVQLLAANHGQKLGFERQDARVIQALANADIPAIANFIKLTQVGSKQAVINDLAARLAERGKKYRANMMPTRKHGRSR